MLGIGINLVAILVIVLFYRLIRRSFFSRVVAQRALQNANDNLESMVVLRTEQLSVLSRHLISVGRRRKGAAGARTARRDGRQPDRHQHRHQRRQHDACKPEHAELAGMLERARATLVDTVQLKRRIVENLRPSLLDNLGLAAALHSYCDEFAQRDRARLRGAGRRRRRCGRADAGDRGVPHRPGSAQQRRQIRPRAPRHRAPGARRRRPGAGSDRRRGRHRQWTRRGSRNRMACWACANAPCCSAAA